MTLLNEIFIISGLAIIVVTLSHRLKIPAIVGFLATGLLVGPHGFSLVRSIHEVDVLAEIGVVLLLFTIGVEFSFRSLWRTRKQAIGGGLIQVALTAAAAFAGAWLLGRMLKEAVFVGFLFSLSSTAIVLKLLQSRAEVETPHGRATVGVLIFQDIIAVPMMLVVPFLGAGSGTSAADVALLAVKAVGIIIFSLVAASWIVPKVFFHVARTRNREIFLLSIVVLILAVTWLTYSAGLSLALGAFLAGLIISESEFSHQVLGNMTPVRDLFTSFFFIAIGMLLDLGFIFRYPLEVFSLVLIVLAVKALLAFIAIASVGTNLRTAVLTGMALCQIGEFSFILSRAGLEHGILDNQVYQLFLACSVLSMAATPFVMALSRPLAYRVSLLPFVRRRSLGRSPSVAPSDGARPSKEPLGHLVIIGFGVNGKNVAKSARLAGIPYVVVEMNADTVREQKRAGENIFLGDATQEEVLEHAKIAKSRVVVVAINDPAATQGITKSVRRLNPSAHLIVRTRFLEEMEPLARMGASEVIPEEFETSVEIFTRVLSCYLVPHGDIERFVAQIRAENYQMLRSLSMPSPSASLLKDSLSDYEVSAIRMGRGSALEGTTIADGDLRRKHGVTVLAVRRGLQTIPNPSAEMQLLADDILIVLGSPENISALSRETSGTGTEKKEMK